jgi:hypothetical protein
MAFTKGKSGNPAGRPRGAKDKRTELRELLKPHAPQLIQRLVEEALDGDVSALRICLDKLIPNIRPKDEALNLPLTGNLTQQGKKIIRAIGNGTVTPSESSTVMCILQAQAKLVESDELILRIERLEEAAQR